MLRLPAFLFLLLTIAVAGHSQRTIAGRVIDLKSGQPIAGGSVFISNSSKGTVTDQSGEFRISDVPTGKHELVVSSIGYETTVYSFSSEQLPLRVRFEMEVKVRELENVTVEPSVEEGWDKWGTAFMKAFIGETPNARRCRIRNNKAIKFRYYRKSNRVIAYCDEQIEIENKALGYVIKFQLEAFEINYKEGSSSYGGYPYFEELDKDRNEVKSRYRKNRDNAYYGSMMHFMRSLYRDSLLQEGFETRRMFKVVNAEKQRVKKLYPSMMRISRQGGRNVYEPRDSVSLDSVRYYQEVLQQNDERQVFAPTLLTADSLVVEVMNQHKLIYFSDYLYITYKKESEAKEYLLYHSERRPTYYQRSMLFLPAGTAIAVDENGSYFPPRDVLTNEYWAWDDKMANLLPLDFEPAEKKD